MEPGNAEFSSRPGQRILDRADAQAVIEISASRIAMAPGTELDVATLTDTAFQGTQSQASFISASARRRLTRPMRCRHRGVWSR